MSNAIRKIFLLFILLDNLFIPLKLGFDFRAHYVLYFLFIVCYPFTYRTVHVRGIVVQSLALLFFLLFFVPLVNGWGYWSALRQLFLIGFNLCFAFLLINAYEYDLKLLFKDYIDLVYIAAIVGIIQILSQMVGFTYGADYSYLGFDMQHFAMSNWKIQSWFQEPSFLAIAFTPVAFAGICRLFKLTDIIDTGRSIVIISVLILSQSTIGLVGLLLSLIIVVTNRYSILRSPLFLLASVILFAGVSLGFYAIPQVRLRVDDTFHLFTASRVTAKDIEGANLSTYSTFSNFRVATTTFKDNVFFGSGLGTYESDYFKHIKTVLPPNRITEQYALNERDANSMLLRLLAELGLFGIVVLVWFLFSNRIKVNFQAQTQEQIDYWIINSAVYVLFLIRLFRQGHYTMLGLMLFVLIYFCSKKQFEKSLNPAIH